jgi:hypothetical protein
MRLQLISVVGLAGLVGLGPLAAPATAAPLAKIDLRSGIYQDSDRTFISTSTVAARGTIKDRVTIEARYLADVISSASVDVVTAATGAFHEVRHEATGALDFNDGTNGASLGYIYSIENDWESHTANAGWSRDLVQHNVTVGLGGTLVHNAVGRAGDRSFHRTLWLGGGTAFVTITPSPRDLVNVSYTLAYLDGYQASPYRFVFFNGPAGSRAAVPETDPETRTRHALTMRWNRHVLSDSAIQSHVRGYVDDWGVWSVTTGLEYLIGLHAWTLGLHARGYFQEHARFYQPTYAAPTRYMTADRELSTFIDGFGGARLQWRSRVRALDELRVEAKVDGFGFWFFDFPRLQSRGGVIAELAIGASL